MPLFRYRFPLLLTLLLAGSAGCARGAETLLVAETGRPMFALLYVAAARGYFDDAGVTVKLRRYPSSTQALEAVQDGQAHLAAVPTPLVTERLLDGEPLGVLSLLHVSSHSSALVALQRRGIAGPRDLPGKRVGLSDENGSSFFLDMFLASAGVNPAAVDRVELPVGCPSQGLEQGRIDAVVASSACVYQLRNKLGPAAVQVFYSEVYSDISVLVGRRDLMNGREEQIVQVLRALHRADHFIRINPEPSLEIVAKALPELDATAVRESWKDIDPQLGLSQLLLAELGLEADWFRARRLSDQPPPEFGRFLMPRFLRQVEPERVTVY